MPSPPIMPSMSKERWCGPHAASASRSATIRADGGRDGRLLGLLGRGLRARGRRGSVPPLTGPPPCRRQPAAVLLLGRGGGGRRSEEHTSELQSLMRSSYAVFCWKKKTTKYIRH